jgi:hypothetical protein
VRDLTQLSHKPSLLAQNVALAALMMLLLSFPSDLFNSTLQEHYEEISSGLFGSFFSRLRMKLGRMPTGLVLGGFAVAGGLLSSQLSPDFAFNRASLALLLGMFLALGATSFIFDVARGAYVRRRFGIVVQDFSLRTPLAYIGKGTLRAFPLGMIIGGLLVLFSRLGHIQPGYLYGLFTGLVFRGELSAEREGESLAIASVSLLSVGLAAWIVWIPIKHLAVHPGAGLSILVLDAALSSLWICSLCTVVFGLAPVRFLNGEKVKAWNKAGWAIVYGLGTFVFVHTALHPKSGGFASTKKTSILGMLAPFIAFAALSLTFWGYFRYRHLWQGTKQEADETEALVRQQ